MDGTVTGTVEATYTADWLLDSNPRRPVRGTTGLTLTANAPAARNVGIIALLNTNVVGTVSVGAHVVPAPTLGEDGMYLNPWVSVTPASASSYVLTATGTPTIIGGLWAGVRRTLNPGLLSKPTFEEAEPFEWEAGHPPYDDGEADPRRLSAETIVNDDGLEAIRAWYRSTRRGTRPSLIVPYPDKQDAWAVTFRYDVTSDYYFTAAQRAADPRSRSVHRVTFEFLEIPRLRWPA